MHLPLNIGAIFQTVIGPSLWNCPRQSSIKNTGNAPRTSTVKYGMIKAPENKRNYDYFKSFSIYIENIYFFGVNAKYISSSELKI